jgi:hypothetical protein
MYFYKSDEGVCLANVTGGGAVSQINSQVEIHTEKENTYEYANRGRLQ